MQKRYVQFPKALDPEGDGVKAHHVRYSVGGIVTCLCGKTGLEDVLKTVYASDSEELDVCEQCQRVVDAEDAREQNGEH